MPLGRVGELAKYRGFGERSPAVLNPSNCTAAQVLYNPVVTPPGEVYKGLVRATEALA